MYCKPRNLVCPPTRDQNEFLRKGTQILSDFTSCLPVTNYSVIIHDCLSLSLSLSEIFRTFPSRLLNSSLETCLILINLSNRQTIYSTSLRNLLDKLSNNVIIGKKNVLSVGKGNSKRKISLKVISRLKSDRFYEAKRKRGRAHSSSGRLHRDASVYQHVVRVRRYRFGDLRAICQRSTGRVAAYQIYIEHRCHRVFTALFDELTCTRARAPGFPPPIRSIDALDDRCTPRALSPKCFTCHRNR